MNSQLKNGGFEINYSNGEIRYRAYIDCEGILPTFDIIRNSILYSAEMFEKYADGLAEIVYKGLSVREAMAKCEAADELEVGG